jgi:ribonuclease III
MTFMEPNCKLDQFIDQFALKMVDKTLLSKALTHKSFAHESDAKTENNERLEFLGDSVLSLLVTQELYRRLGDHSEGDLSKLRSFIVNEASLTKLADSIDLSSLLRLGKGEQKELRGSIKADAFEALLGAIYLSQGFFKVEEFWQQVLSVSQFDPYHLDHLANFDAKSKLQEYCLGRFKRLPLYTVSEVNQSKGLVFRVTLSIENYPLLSTYYPSKKKAELMLAQDCLKYHLHLIPKGEIHAS